MLERESGGSIDYSVIVSGDSAAAAIKGVAGRPPPDLIIVAEARYENIIINAAEMKNAGALIVMIIVLMIRPQGIFGRRERVG